MKLVTFFQVFVIFLQELEQLETILMTKTLI